MVSSLPSVTSVMAHTESGPVGERAAVELPLNVASANESSSMGESVTAVTVHAQLPVENPILEHATFQAGRSLSIGLRLPVNQLLSPILCLYQHKEWWMRPTWVKNLYDIPERTQMLMWKTSSELNDDHDEQWHVLLAVSNGASRADIRANASADSGDAGTERATDQVLVDISTNQAGRSGLDGLALVYAHGDDPYALVQRCALYAAEANNIRTVSERPFPKALQGLGWCTWDSLGQDVSEQAILEKMREFQTKRVPISWVLIDDGWSRTSDSKLTGFEATPSRFPQGLAHTVKVLKSEFGVRYVGVWQAFQGYWHGVDPAAPDFTLLHNVLETLPNGMTVPAVPSAQSSDSTTFWRRWDMQLADAGVDFVKVDSQSTMSVFTCGVESFSELGERHRMLDEVTAELFDSALINCMGMAPENYWHRPSSPITRTSDDFFPNIPESLAEHAIENAYCSLLLGNLYHCDWDMFWTKHPHARTHALLRWISGGPIYCSDALGDTDAELLRAFVNADGTINRPERVGVPVESSLLADPVHGETPLGIRNTYRGREVVLFVGLNAGRAQHVTLTAGREPITVNLPDGSKRTVAPGECFECDLNYGDSLLVRY